MAGRVEQATELAHHLDTWWSEMTDLERGDAFYLRGVLALDAESPTMALDHLHHAMHLYQSTGARQALADAAEMIAGAWYSLGEVDEAESAMHQAEAYQADLDRPDLMFELLASRASLAAIRGDLDQALAHIRAARALLMAPSPLAEIYLGMCHTDALMLHARPVAELQAAGSRSLDAAAEFGLDHKRVCIIRTNIADAMLRAGRVQEAAELLEPVTLDDPTLDRWVSHLYRARVDAVRGELTRAGSALERLDDLPVTGRLDYAWDAAHIELDAGRFDAAMVRLDSALTSDRSLSRAFYAGPAVALALRAAADLVERGGRVDDRLLQRLRTFEAPALPDARHDAVWRLLRALELARIDGRFELDGWGRATAAWDELEQPHDAAYCRLRAAQAALAQGRGVAAHRLLERAARDARQHLPLSSAIEETAAHAVRS